MLISPHFISADSDHMKFHFIIHYTFITTTKIFSANENEADVVKLSIMTDPIDDIPSKQKKPKTSIFISDKELAIARDTYGNWNSDKSRRKNAPKLKIISPKKLVTTLFLHSDMIDILKKNNEIDYYISSNFKSDSILLRTYQTIIVHCIKQEYYDMREAEEILLYALCVSEKDRESVDTSVVPFALRHIIDQQYRKELSIDFGYSQTQANIQIPTYVEGPDQDVIVKKKTITGRAKLIRKNLTKQKK